MVRYLAVLVLAGCAVGEPIECAFSYRASPELQLVTERAAERWSAATGCQLTVAPDGAALVEMVSYLPRGDGKEAPAATSEGGMLIQVHERSPDIERSVLHEMGHSLGMTGHNEGYGVLSYHKDYVAIIDSRSLADVCESIPCRAFVPEGEP